MNLVPIAAAVAGAVAAPALDHFKPEWGKHVMGQHVEPGSFASLALILAGIALKSPAIAMAGFGGGLVEVGKVTAQNLLTSAPPGGGQLPPAGGGAVSGYGSIVGNDPMLAAALGELDSYLR